MLKALSIVSPFILIDSPPFMGRGRGRVKMSLKVYSKAMLWKFVIVQK